MISFSAEGYPKNKIIKKINRELNRHPEEVNFFFVIIFIQFPIKLDKYVKGSLSLSNRKYHFYKEMRGQNNVCLLKLILCRYKH